MKADVVFVCARTRACVSVRVCACVYSHSCVCTHVRVYACTGVHLLDHFHTPIQGGEHADSCRGGGGVRVNARDVKPAAAHKGASMLLLLLLLLHLREAPF